MNKELEARIAKLRELYAKQPVALTENILDGFIAAWEKPGYGPAGKYLEAVIATGRFWEFWDAAVAAGRSSVVLLVAIAIGRVRDVLTEAIATGRFWEFWDAAVAAGQTRQLLSVALTTDQVGELSDVANDAQKEALCDAADV